MRKDKSPYVTSGILAVDYDTHCPRGHGKMKETDYPELKLTVRECRECHFQKRESYKTTYGIGIT